MLLYDSVKMKSKIFKVELHSPVQKTDFVKSAKGQQIWYTNDRIFYSELESQLSFFPIKVRNTKKMRLTDEVVTYARSISLEPNKNRFTSNVSS